MLAFYQLIMKARYNDTSTIEEVNQKGIVLYHKCRDTFITSLFSGSLFIEEWDARTTAATQSRKVKYQHTRQLAIYSPIWSFLKFLKGFCVADEVGKKHWRVKFPGCLDFPLISSCLEPKAGEARSCFVFFLLNVIVFVVSEIHCPPLPCLSKWQKE